MLLDLVIHNSKIKNIGEYINKNNYGFIEIHLTENYDISKLIVGFNDIFENKSHNFLEIR